MPSSVSRRRTRACASAPAGATRGLSTSPRCRQPVPRAAPHSAQSQSHGWSPATALPFFVRRRSPTARRDGGAVRVRVPRTLQPHAQNASCKHVLPFPAGPARRAGVRERESSYSNFQPDLLAWDRVRSPGAFSMKSTRTTFRLRRCTLETAIVCTRPENHVYSTKEGQ